VLLPADINRVLWVGLAKLRDSLLSHLFILLIYIFRANQIQQDAHDVALAVKVSLPPPRLNEHFTAETISQRVDFTELQEDNPREYCRLQNTRHATEFRLSFSHSFLKRYNVHAVSR
jgi:hypothetical protein